MISNFGTLALTLIKILKKNSQADIDPYTDPYQNLKEDHYADYTNFDEPINDNKMRDEIQMQFSVRTKNCLHSSVIFQC